MVIIKDSYANYENKMAAPAHHDINGGYAVDTATRWRNNSMNNAAQFLKMQLFRAALPGDLWKVVAQRNPNTLTLDKMYQIVMDTQRESGPKFKKTIAAVHIEDEEVAAFQRWKFSKSTDRKKASNLMKGSYKLQVFSLKSLMTPLIQAPSVIPQLIPSSCTILIATCNKLFEIMTPINADKIRKRLLVRAGNKTFSWLFDTGAVVTCMNKESFDLAFGHY